MNELIVAQEIDKIKTLSVISEENKQALMAAAPYTTIPYMPITTEFIEKHILNNVEYPLVESKLSQAAIELKSRINRLVDAQFNINKLNLELEELELDIEEIKSNKDLSEKRVSVQVAKKQLEIQQKKWMILGYTNDAESCFKEFTQWKQTVEDCVEVIKKNDPSVKDFKDIDYDKIRCAEIQIKIQRWKHAQEQGAELTPSQKALVEG